MPTRIKKPRRHRHRRPHHPHHRLLIPLALLALLILGTGSPPPPTTPQPPRSHLAPPAQHIKVYDPPSNQVLELDFETYLTGVVAAEMPANFEPEALKAQAVAARTFAYSRLHSPAADPAAAYCLTTDPATCQAWISTSQQQQRWGDQYAANSHKIAQAVQGTAGQLITYQGQPIEPLYHASCGGGRTESAQDVWGNDRPYLVSVPCNHPPDKHNGQQQVLSLAQLDSLLGTDLEALPAATGGARQLITISASSPSDRVRTIQIDGKSFSGTQIRSILGLKSTLFAYQIHNDQITFTTNGYGHGVGLCQYGANYYAQQGKTYQQILTHYYTNTKIEKVK